ncbi:MAG: DUF1800 family protein [Actinobacteria bacterium]|nr:DUF1800 family protein [Actinomycetota bacterium]
MADAADIAHLLRRTEFVARPARIAALSALSLDDAVTDVMNVALNANPQLPPELAVHNSSDSYNQRVAAFHWWLDVMATRPRPFQEKMTLFWHGHFTSEWEVVQRCDHMMSQNQLYRTAGLGNFLPLTQAMSLEPAMLIYLSNATNVKGAPNENFARELLELFTLGVGNYTQDDVAAAARAWTGHNYNSQVHAYEFRSSRHDTTNKTFFGTTKNWDGPDIVNEVLRDNAVSRGIAARLIAKKLWEFFAYPHDALLLAAVTRGIALVDIARWTARLHAALLRLSTESLSAPVVLASGWMGGVAPLLAMAAARQVWPPTSIEIDILYGAADLAGPDSVDYVATYFGLTLAPASRQALIDAHQAERAAANGSNSRAVTNLLIMTMLTGEMNVA